MFFALLFLVFSFSCFSQESSIITYSGNGNYNLTERTDLRRYENNRYVGLFSREVKSFISCEPNPLGNNLQDRYYKGNFYVTQFTRSGMREINNGIHSSIPSAFRISKNGTLVMLEDNGYPSFRSFPSFNKESIKKGDSWIANAERSVDPLEKSIPTKMPILVQYTYIDDGFKNEEEIYIISAKWATRYGEGFFTDYKGDKELIKASGSHNATMHISKKTGNAIVIRDNVDETFFYSDGKQIQFKGTISLFTDYPPSIDRTKIIPVLQRIANLSEKDSSDLSSKIDINAENTNLNKDKSNLNDNKNIQADFFDSNTNSSIKVDNTPSGIRLTMINLQFKADSAELLPQETLRLDELAKLLTQIENSGFLVEGHTANTGFTEGEQKLSEQRSYALAKALTERGVPASKFICSGSGSKKPIADNSTPEGRAMNRRVEITILE